MNAIKEITVSVNNRAFSLDLALEDLDLIEAIFDALTDYVHKGSSIKVREAYVTSLSDSTKIISRIISTRQQMDEWRAETKQLISVIRKGR